MSEGRQAAARVSDPTATEPPWGVAAADDLPVPEPAADEVLVRVLAAPVHSFDNYLLYPKEYVGEVPIPSVPGLEGKLVPCLSPCFVDWDVHRRASDELQWM